MSEREGMGPLVPAEEMQIAPDDLDVQVRTLTVMAAIVLLAVAVMLVAIGAAMGMVIAAWRGVCT